MQIYLVRHAQEKIEVALNSDGGITGLGRRQAYAAAHYLKKQGIQVLLASDLPRAHETAHIIDEVLQLGVKTLPTLREIQTPKGAWSEYVKTRHPDFDYHPGGGESVSELVERTKTAWKEILAASAGRNTAVIGHGIFTKALLYHLGFKDFLIRNDAIANTGITTLEVEGDSVQLAKFNYYGHLRELRIEEIFRRFLRIG